MVYEKLYRNTLLSIEVSMFGLREKLSVDLAFL